MRPRVAWSFAMSSSGMPYGLQALLKDGHKHLSGLDEAVVKNIDACRQLSKITRTSLGPNGAGADFGGTGRGASFRPLPPLCCADARRQA